MSSRFPAWQLTLVLTLLAGAAFADSASITPGFDPFVTPPPGAPHPNLGVESHVTTIDPLGASMAAKPGLPVLQVSTTPSWTYEGNVVGKQLGKAVCTVGDVNGDGYSDIAAVSDSLTNSRKLYLFFGGPGGPTLAPGYPAFIQVSAVMLAPAGDLNGDGFADLGVLSDGGGSALQLKVYYGTATGFNLAAPFTATNIYINGGGSIAPAGDVNGDGYDDFMMGIHTYGRQQTICGTAGGVGYGRVDLYYGSATGLTQAPSWILLGCQWYNVGGLGASLGTAGDVNADGYDDIVVGVPGGVPSGGGTVTGVARVIYGNPAGLPLVNGFTDLGSLAGSTELAGFAANSGFGDGACAAGDINGDGYADVAVGADFEDYFSTFTDNGAVRIFAGSAGGITTTVLWYEVGPFNGNHFGQALAPGGDINGDGLADLLVGNSTGIAIARSIGPTMIIQTGLAYTSPNTATFGTAGDVNADGISDIVVGDWPFTGGENFEGRVVVHYGRGDGPTIVPVWTATTAGLDNPNFGWSVASAGDVNNDGYDDVIFGSPGWDNFTVPGDTDNGIVFMAYGGLNGISVPTYNFAGFGVSGDQIGIAVTGGVDFNGDGFADIAAGGHQPAGNGKVMIWYGKVGGPNDQSVPNVTLTGPSVGSLFGAALAVGDFNGDGYGDLVVGAPYDDADTGPPFFFPRPDAGRAFMYLGGPGGLNTSPAWTGQGFQSFEHYGTALAGYADINGDGYSDVVVGAPDFDAQCGPFTCADLGRLFEYHGGPNAPYLTFTQNIINDTNEAFGSHLAHAGDVNGDGYGDIIVGAPNGGPQGQGRAAVYAGSPSGLIVTPIWNQVGYEVNSSFGSSVSTAGDVDGDGLSDILVGGVFEDLSGAQDRGTCRVFTGPLPGGAAAFQTLTGSSTFENVGHSVACAGDIDKDGWPDIILGAPGFSQDYFRQGHILVHMGSLNYARFHLAFPAKSTGARIMPLGFTENGGFNLFDFSRSAAGRTRMRMNWQVRGVVGLPGTGTLTGNGAWTLSNPPAPLGSYAILGAPIAPTKYGAPYSWRVRSLSRSVYFPTTAWLQPALNGAREFDLRGPGSWVAVGDPTPEPTLLAMSDAYPNPSRGISEISFTLPSTGDVTLAVLDLQGRKVRTLQSGPLAAGRHQSSWDGRTDRGGVAPAGLYFYKLEMQGRGAISRKVALVR